MTRSLSFALALVLATAGSAAAQAMAPAGAPGEELAISLGPLATGRISRGETVGRVGLLGSDLQRVLQASPEAERYARIFNHDARIGRPLLLAGAGLVVGGLTAYVAHHGQLGMGGREIAAFGAGGVAFMLGADRLSASRRALRRAVDEYNLTATGR